MSETQGREEEGTRTGARVNGDTRVPFMRHYKGPRWFGREVPGWDSLDARRRGETWSEWRDYLPCARFKVLLLPWNWRLRPRVWMDDLTFSCSASWLLVEVEVFA